MVVHALAQAHPRQRLARTGVALVRRHPAYSRGSSTFSSAVVRESRLKL